MYASQLIISVVVFGALLYLMSSKQENYTNYAPYYTPPYRYNQPTLQYGDYKSFNQMNRSKAQFQRYNIEGYSNDTELINPKVGKSDAKVVKVIFCLMVVGLLYYLYENNKI